MPDDITNGASRVAASAVEYVTAGFVLVPIPHNQKGPTAPAWNKRDLCVSTAARASNLRGNIGLAHAYSGTCAIDFDKLDSASAWLSKHGIDAQVLLNASDAVRITSGRPNRAKLLYRLPLGVDPLPTKKLDDDGIEFRCASSNGLTVQDVLPPSIHPDTGEPYRWEYGDELVGDWRNLPTLPAALLDVWRGLLTKQALEPVTKQRLNLTEGQLRHALTLIDADCGYDDWLHALMAVHHETGGQPYGLDLVDTWSSTSAKYPGREALEQKWDSFGRNRSNEVTARWLLGKTNVASPDEFEDLTAQSEPTNPFTVIPADEFARRPSPGWIVQGVLPRADLAVMYGDSGSGKTFAALDLVASVARGADWRGHKVKHAGRCAYVVAEGSGGFQSRLKAYSEYHGATLTGAQMGVIPAAPNLMLPADVKRLIEALEDDAQRFGPHAVIVLDTWARVTAGANENSGEDMGKALITCKRLRDRFGALVLLIHHSGKDAARGARGWSGLRAAADAEFEVLREGDRREIRLTKQKDGDDGETFGFKLHAVDVGVDEEGDPVKSCVVVPASGRVKVREPKGSNEKLILRVLTDMAELGGTSVDANAVVDAAIASMVTDPDKRDRRKETARRALQSLVDDAFCSLRDGLVSLRSAA